MMYCIACSQEVIQEIHNVFSALDGWDWCDGDGGEVICACPPSPVPNDEIDWFAEHEPSEEETLISFSCN